MAGLVGYVFDLISEFTSFWPQTDRVYLFLAAALFFPAEVPGSRRGLTLTPQLQATPKHAPTGCMSSLVYECAKTF